MARKISQGIKDKGEPKKSGLEYWMGQAYGIAYLVGDALLGKDIAECWDTGDFSCQPLATVFIAGLVGWWVGLPLFPRFLAAQKKSPDGIFLTWLPLIVAAMPLTYAAMQRFGWSLDKAEDILWACCLFLVLVFLQWWLLSGLRLRDVWAWLKRETKIPQVEAMKSEEDGDSSKQTATQTREKQSYRPSPFFSSPLARVVGGLLFLPMGLALMGFSDVFALRAEESLVSSPDSPLSKVWMAAFGATWCTFVAFLGAIGPLQMGSVVVGERMGALRFSIGLWLVNFGRLVIAAASSW